MAARKCSAFLWRAISFHKGTLILYLISNKKKIKKNNGYQWNFKKFLQCRVKRPKSIKTYCRLIISIAFAERIFYSFDFCYE